MNTCMVYITASGPDEAGRIVQTLLEERLIACANILDGIRSRYWWQGEIASAEEVVVICKTRESLVPSLIERVKALHSYECPCIVSLPIANGNPDFLEWICRETARESS